MVTITDIRDLSLDSGWEGNFCFSRNDHDGAVFADNAAASAAMLMILAVAACIVVVGIGLFIISGNNRRRSIAVGTISGLQADVGSTW